MPTSVSRPVGSKSRGKAENKATNAVLRLEDVATDGVVDKHNLDSILEFLKPLNGVGEPSDKYAIVADPEKYRIMAEIQAYAKIIADNVRRDWRTARNGGVMSLSDFQTNIIPILDGKYSYGDISRNSLKITHKESGLFSLHEMPIG